MHKDFMKKASFFLMTAVLFAVSCAQELQENDLLNPSQDAIVTKAINSPQGSIEGNLIVKISEDVADAGYESLMCQISEKMEILSMRPVFPLCVKEDETARKYDLHRWYRVDFEGMSNEDAALKLSSFDAISSIQFNKSPKLASDCRATGHAPALAMMNSSALPFNDPMLVDQWHYINNKDMSVALTSRTGADINVKNAWGLTAGDPRIIVAVCDEGVKYTHPDLAENMWVNKGEIAGNGIDDDNNGYVDDIHGWNFLSTEKYPKEISWNEPGDVSHGTHVAGTVAAVNNNGIGVSGVAGGTGNGDGCRIMSCQVFSGSSSATVGARARAYHYAAQMGAAVLQCSYGQEGGLMTSDDSFEKTYSVEIAALRYFRDFGNQVNGSPVNKNIIVFAAGNDATPMSGYPAAHKEFISVTAFGPDYLPTNYTNYGPGSNIAAPGGDVSINQSTTSERAQILSTVATESGKYESNYGWMQGTSMACPHVSGIVALGLSYGLKLGKTYDYDEFMGIFYSSVNDIDYYIETCTKMANGVNFDLTPFWKQMGTGAIDTWKFLMNLEGTPNIVAKVGEESKVSLVPCFGGAAPNLTYTKIEISDDARQTLGIEGEPYINNGRLFVKCTKYGSAKISITAIAGGDTAATDAVMGGTEFTREVSLLSRDSIAENGGWL